MLAIYKKELRVAFGGMFGWAICALLLFFYGLFTVLYHLLAGYTDFSFVYASMHVVLAVLIPFLTMRSIAEERHTRTDRLLYSLPVKMHRIVIGKFLAMLTVFALPTAVAGLYPVLLSFFGDVSLLSAAASWVGFVLLGGALIAVCTFVSSLVENQILAAVLSLAATLLLYFADTLAGLLPTSATACFFICVVLGLLIGAGLCWISRRLLIGAGVACVLCIGSAVVYLIRASLFEGLIGRAVAAVAVFARYSGFVDGYFDLSAAVLYVSLIGLFLFLTHVSMEKRRLM